MSANEEIRRIVRRTRIRVEISMMGCRILTAIAANSSWQVERLALMMADLAKQL